MYSKLNYKRTRTASNAADFMSLITGLRSDAENGDVFLIFVLRMREVIFPEILTSSNQVPNVKTLRFTFSQNLNKRVEMVEACTSKQ